MKDETVERILDGAKLAYFDARLDGSGSSHSVTTQGEDGTITVAYQSDLYLVVDRFRTSPVSKFTEGTTRIFYDGESVWEMAYDGHYPSEVIPFLKKALCEAYKEKGFYGGRGPRHFGENAYMYHNTFEGDFAEFKGRECVVNIIGVGPGHELGFHNFAGRALI